LNQAIFYVRKVLDLIEPGYLLCSEGSIPDWTRLSFVFGRFYTWLNQAIFCVRKVLYLIEQGYLLCSEGSRPDWTRLSFMFGRF